MQQTCSCILSPNSSGFRWHNVCNGTLQEERAAGNPVANLIRKLSLEANRITLELPNWLAAEDEEGGEEPEEDDSEGDEEEAAPSTSPTVRKHVSSI